MFGLGCFCMLFIFLKFIFCWKFFLMFFNGFKCLLGIFLFVWICLVWGLIMGFVWILVLVLNERFFRKFFFFVVNLNNVLLKLKLLGRILFLVDVLLVLVLDGWIVVLFLLFLVLLLSLLRVFIEKWLLKESLESWFFEFWWEWCVELCFWLLIGVFFGLLFLVMVELICCVGGRGLL